MVRGGVGLEGSTLVLGGARVGRRKVGMVEAGRGGHAGHADATDPRGGGRGRVREGRRHGTGVMHPGVGKPGLSESRQRGKGAIELTRVGEGVQLRRACLEEERRVAG